MSKRGGPFWESVKVGEDASAQGWLEALELADWSAFSPARDLGSLRSLLLESERKEGIGALHRWVTEVLADEWQMVLMHNFGHEAELTCSALSPDGRTLVTGSELTSNYDLGAVVQVWELATGRCVNCFCFVPWGAGSKRNDVAGTFQWPRDHRQLGMVYSENHVTHLNPFARSEKADDPPFRTCIAFLDGSGFSPYAWSPDGKGMAFSYHFGEERLPLGIQRLHGGWAYHDVHPFELDDSDEYVECAPDEEIPEESTRFSYSEGEFPWLDWLGWTRDGARIFGYTIDRIYNSSSARAYCVQAADGRPVYSLAVGRHVAFSPDEKFFVYTLPGGGGGVLKGYDRMVYTGMKIADAGDAKTVFAGDGIEGIVEFHWSRDEEESRLAVIAQEGEGGSRVHIFAGATPLCDFAGGALADVSYGAHPDRALWSWSPDGMQGLLLTSEGVERWRVDGEPQKLAQISVPSGTEVVYWGARDVLACVGSRLVAFVELESGVVLASHPIHGSREELMAEAPSPLLLEEGDLNHQFPTMPFFPLKKPGSKDAFVWVGAFAQGPVVAPQEVHEGLDDALHYVLSFSDEEDEPLGAMAWPFRWGEVSLHASIKTALQEPTIALEDAKREALCKALEEQDEEQPLDLSVTVLPNEAQPPLALEALFACYDDAVDGDNKGRDDHYYTQTVFAALCGRPQEAIARAQQAEDLYQHAGALARAALFSAATGQLADARVLVEALDACLTAGELRDWSMSYVYAPLYGAYRLLSRDEGASQEQREQDAQKAESAFEKAQIELDNESNSFQKYRLLAEAHVHCGEYDEALAIYDAHGERGGHFSLHMARPIVELFFGVAPDDAVARLMEILASNVVDNNQELAQHLESRFLREEDWDSFVPWLRAFFEADWMRERVSRKVLGALAKRGLQDVARRLWAGVWEAEDLFAEGGAEVFDLRVWLEGEGVREELEERLAGAQELVAERYPWSRLEALVLGAAHLGLGEEVDRVLGLYANESRRLATLRVLLCNAEIAMELREACWQKWGDASDDGSGEAGVELAHCAHAVGDMEAVWRYIDRLEEEIVTLSGYDRAGALERLMKLHLELGERRQAVETWLKQAPSNRRDNGRALLKEFGERGMLEALLLVLKKIPKQERLRAIEEALPAYLKPRVALATFVHDI